MFPFNGKTVYSNRGTSGIDGCLSTASGIAANSTEIVYAILGDLSFIYDSNALWNRDLPKNLRIILVNNSGGGIFGLIDGPSGADAYNKYFVANHPVSVSKLCEAFAVNYIENNETYEFETVFEMLRNESGASLLEIKTPSNQNPEIFRNFMKNITQKRL